MKQSKVKIKKSSLFRIIREELQKSLKEDDELEEKNVQKLDLAEIRKIILEEITAGDVAAGILGGPLGFLAKRGGESAADSDLVGGISSMVDKMSAGVSKGIEDLKEKGIETLKDSVADSKEVRRVLAMSNSDIVEYLFDNLPTPVKTRYFKLYSKDNIKIKFVYTDDEDIYFRLKIDGPLTANIELEYDIKDFLFEDLTDAGIESWAIGLHGDVFAKIKTTAVAAVGLEEFKKYKRQGRALIQSKIIDDKKTILAKKAEAFQLIAKIFHDNPYYILGVQGLDSLTSVDIPFVDIQEELEDEIANRIQLELSNAIISSGIGRQIIDSLDDLNEMVEEMHEQKRDKLRSIPIVGGLAASLGEQRKVKIKKSQLKNIIREAIFRVLAESVTTKGRKIEDYINSRSRGNKFRNWANSTPELIKKYGKDSTHDLDKGSSGASFDNSFIKGSFKAGGDEWIDSENIQPAPRADESADSEGNAVLKYNVTKSPLVVFFYPGTGYGKQPFVKAKFKEFASQQNTKNTIVIIGKSHTTDFSSLLRTYQSLNIEAGKMYLGGWSGGAIGLASAQNHGQSFDKVIYVDPSPPYLVVGGKYSNAPKDHKNAKMYYNPDNWKSVSLNPYGNYKKVMVDELAPQLGDNAKKSNVSHKNIFFAAARELLVSE